MSDIVIKDNSGVEVKRFSEYENMAHSGIISSKIVFRDIENGHPEMIEDIFGVTLSVNNKSIEDFIDDKRNNIELDDSAGSFAYTVELDTSTTSGVKVTVGNNLPAPITPNASGTLPVPSSNPLPPADPNTFVGEFHDMDLSELQGKMYGVAINSGPQDGTKFICSSLCAPLDFYEMIETVGSCWEREQIHAKVFTLKKTFDERMKFLDAPTIDYIESRYMDLIADGLLSGALSENKQYMCRAGFFEEAIEEKQEDAQ